MKFFRQRLNIAWRSLIGKSDAGFQVATFNALDVLERQPEPIEDFTTGRTYNLSDPADWNAVCSQLSPTAQGVAARMRLQEENRRRAGLPVHQMGFIERFAWIAKRRWKTIRGAFRGDYDYLWENDAKIAEIEERLR